PASNVRLATNSGNVTVNWTASSDSVLGYHLYRASAANGSFSRVTDAPVTSTSYTDASGSGTNYMVRAVKLETTASGSFYNQSIGAFATLPTSGGTTGSTGSTNSTGGTTGSTNTPLTTTWLDDAIPSGAQSGADGGDSWNWVSSNPTPYSGTVCSLSSIGGGLHEHFFSWASQTMSVSSGEVLFAYVYIDPANPPS